MKKIMLAVMIVVLFSLTSCNTYTQSKTEASYGKLPSTYGVLLRNGGKTGLDPANIAGIRIKDIEKNQEVEYTNHTLVNEFCTFLKKQEYSKTEEEWHKDYQVQLFDQNRMCVLDITLGARAVTFNGDTMLDKAVIAKGTYEVGQWISDYMKELFEGAVLDPEYIKYPAYLKTPEDSYVLEMINKGSGKVNQYNTYTRLYDFIGNNFSGKQFELLGSRKIYSYEQMEQEVSKTKNENECVTIQYSSSRTYLNISSMNEYSELSLGYVLTLSKYAHKPFTYKLVTDNMVYDIRVADEFDKGFQAIFESDGNVQKNLTPNEIKALFDGNKPYYMEYICKNLGIKEWNGRDADKLEKKMMNLDNDGSTYTVLCIYNPFQLRMLIFKEGKNKDSKFVDYIDFGGRTAGTEYNIETIGNRTFITGNRCRGYGTGIGLYYKEWYSVSDEGSKMVLSFPYSEFEEPPYGGYSMAAVGIKIESNGAPKIGVDYSITKRYHIDLGISGQDGVVEVTGKKKVVFQWDSAKSMFVSEYTPDEEGITRIPPESKAMTEKCNSILGNHYQKLLGNIKSLPDEQNESARDFRAKAIKAFLNDCPESDKKAEACKQLKSIGF